VTLGPPIHNTQFYVLDKNTQPLPAGIAGELYIGGDGVAKGYYKNPTLTADRFILDPFSSTPGSRLYKTGDLVRYRLRVPDPRGLRVGAEAELEFLGRLDNQVKIRGFRIELGEIESALARHPVVRECVVVPQETEPGLKRLAAFLVSDEPAKPATDELRRWLSSQLPDYMVPSLFTVLPSLPHTPNGKVDRKALATSNAQDSTEPHIFTPPRTPTELQLAEICAQVLQLESVSITDSLFDLGADSLHLFQIIARAARAALRITPQQILRLRTISALAADLERTSSANGHSTKNLEKIAPVSREQYQLSSAPQTT
jgi:acyl carrier protein